MIIQPDGISCINKLCGDNHKINKDGTCSQCPKSEILSIDKKSCIGEHHCKDNEILLDLGACFPCPDYQRPRPGNFCGPDNCDLRYKLLKDGTCEKCPDYESLSQDKRSCYLRTCNSN